MTEKKRKSSVFVIDVDFDYLFIIIIVTGIVVVGVIVVVVIIMVLDVNGVVQVLVLAELEHFGDVVSRGGKSAHPLDRLKQSQLDEQRL